MMRPLSRPTFALHPVLLLGFAALLSLPPSTARAQDSTATGSKVTSTFQRTGEERDRLELGGGVAKGFFDVVGSLAYRRFMGESRTIDRSLMMELTGSAKDQLTEGVLSVYLLLRPKATYRESQRIRPLIEFGPAVHTVLQVASLEGLNKTRYKSQIYIKSHAYAGFEVLATNKVGFLIRGRFTVPSHRPMDYAQAAIFLR